MTTRSRTSIRVNHVEFEGEYEGRRLVKAMLAGDSETLTKARAEQIHVEHGLRIGRYRRVDGLWRVTLS